MGIVDLSDPPIDYSFDPFSEGHLAHLRKFLGDEAAYAALAESFPRLKSIIAEAKKRGCTGFSCTMDYGRACAVKLRFAKWGASERYLASISYRRSYEKISGKSLDSLVALAVKQAVQELVLRTPGFNPAVAVHGRRKTTRIDCLRK